MSRIYAMKENLTKEDWGPHPVDRDQAIKLNSAHGYGIFRSVNEFNGPRRTINLKAIRAWHVDIDGDKAQQTKLINNAPIWASRIVETKNGFHLYFNAVDATLKNHREIMESLTAYYKGDKRARMVTAILREPGFLHQKDPNNPFKVKEIFNDPDIKYTEKDMLYMFPSKKNVHPIATIRDSKFRGENRTGLTRYLNNMDCEWGLTRLSGSPYVGGEVYSFKSVPGGKKNILVNGKSTSCFIDEHKKIGASPGGPTLFQWLSYFGHDGSSVYKILKEQVGGGI